MTSITVNGDPEAVCSFLSSIVAAGNEINILKKTKNNSEYIVIYSATSGGGDAILLESGDYLLLESGDHILLE